MGYVLATHDESLEEVDRKIVKETTFISIVPSESGFHCMLTTHIREFP